MTKVGFAPKIFKIDKEGCIQLYNHSEDIILWKKNTHLGDLREAISSDEAKIQKLYSFDAEDYVPSPRKESYSDNASFLEDVVLDPDNQLTLDWKSKFRDLCENYSDIIKYAPGTYNGKAGYTKNTIEFSSIPPPNSRCYVPKYSKEQMDMLATKMDELLDL